MRQLHGLRELKGYTLLARDGEIGQLEQVYFDDDEWVVRYFVVRTGGWLLGREVLIAPRAVQKLDQEHKHIEVGLSRDQVENAPASSSRPPVSRHYEAEYHRHYGWPPYWESSPLGVPLPAPPVPPITYPIREPSNPHLRDSGEVVGYRLQTRDGEFGHVHDLMLDDQEWHVRYLVVDTGSWLPGKKVLVAPAWIAGVEWTIKTINVDLDEDAIRTAPAYNPDRLISRDDEVSLYSHYGKAMQAAGNSDQEGVHE